ncbi:hypothetical protein FQN57_007000 [Myotisia sp. PD_48]|nr:hypothetical protein FQN57_007000 [Myotisia sp. PD_48]
MLQSCSKEIQDTFGPKVVDSCVGGFDFTLLFEESILTLLPQAIATIWALQRLLALRNATTIVKSSWLLFLKLFLFASYIILHITVLAVWVVRGVQTTRLTVATLALTIACYSMLLVISYLEHVRSPRPSTLLCVYLGISVLLDIARVRTLFVVSYSTVVAGVFLAAFIIKILILVSEIVEKRNLLGPDWKDASPEDTGGVFNRALFIWLNDVFQRGFRTLLTVNTLPPLDSDILSASKPSTLIQRWEKGISNICLQIFNIPVLIELSLADKSNEHALLWVFLVHYKWSFLAGVLPRLAYTGFSFSQPYLVMRVLDFTGEPENQHTKNTGYGLIGAYAVVYIGLALSFVVYQHKTYRLLTLYRGSLISLIFDKTLNVCSSVVTDAEAITLMSADIDRISNLTIIHELYACFIDVAVCLWLLYDLLGVTMVAPIIWIILCLIVGVPVANAAGNAQIPWLEAIEVRLEATSKMLKAMKAIRMTGLSDIVSQKVGNSRLSEIRASRRHRILSIFVFVISFSSFAIAPIWGFGAYILLARANNSETLTEGVAFAALSLFELLNQPVMTAIDGVEHVKTVMNSFHRIQEYLMLKEREEYRITPTVKKISSDLSSPILQEDNEKGLNELSNFQFNSTIENSLVAAVAKDVSARYTSDGDPVLNNVSFDIPRGQITMICGPVGSGKSTLLKLLLGETPYASGSVKANFSSAAYCPQSSWTVWGTVQHNIVGMSPWDKTWYDTVVHACALPADLEELSDGDQTNIGTHGSRLSGGQQMRVSFARALYSKSAVMVLDDVLSGLDWATERSILEGVFGSKGMLKDLQTTVILATSSASHLAYADHVICLDNTGQIARQGTPESVSTATKDIEELGKQPTATLARLETEIPEALQELELLADPEPDVSRKTGDLKVYAYYGKMAGWWTISAYLFACAVFVFGVTFPSIWLQWWTNANATHPNERIGYWLGVYGALAGLTLLGCALADSVFNLEVLPKTARKFHELLLTATMRAPTSFLTSTDAGTTINRFSQDLELIDSDLPTALDQTIFQFLSTIVTAVLVALGSGYIAAALPLCIVALVLVGLYYLRTSRQLRLLDIEAKAPLFSHFLATVSGISCIRAYGWTQEYMERSYKALNLSQKPFYILFCIQRWLTLVLDLLNAGVAILLVALATNVKNGSTEFLGVALFNIVTFSSTLQTLVTEWTQVEMALGAINRIRAYVINVQDENLPDETDEVPETWPENGAITLTNVSASYESSLKPALKEINLVIKAGEKVSICGRTGSGKTSLVATLLRMLDIESGSISIDGQNISKIPRQEVRRRLNTLPQDPFFLHGTVRENLDPFEAVNDERIEEVLRAVGMWEFFDSRDGLDGDLDEDELSHGQRQLVCLARAVIKPGNILILDEATSSVDSETDELMQRVLREEFRGRTIIAITHKLNTVLDYDRIVLLDKGQIIETGNPQDLLATPTSAFKELYNNLSTESE